jgi:elongation factor P
MDVSELRKNAKLQMDGHPFVVTDFQFVKPGKGQGLYKCKLKNMITGATIDRTWRSGERLEAANVESRRMQYLFAGGNGFTFMDSENYEQVALRRARRRRQATSCSSSSRSRSSSTTTARSA